MDTKVEIIPLKGKYYETELIVQKGDTSVYVCLSGGCYSPSAREVENGWTREDGMNHVESQTTWEVAQAIKKALEGH